MTDGLFEMEPRERLQVGEQVVAQCSWGEESGRVTSHVTRETHVTIRVRLDLGPIVELTPGRVRRA